MSSDGAGGLVGGAISGGEAQDGPGTAGGGVVEAVGTAAGAVVGGRGDGGAARLVVAVLSWQFFCSAVLS